MRPSPLRVAQAFGSARNGIEIIWRFFSNVQRIEGELPDELLNVMNTRPTIQRTRRDFSDQFFYTYVKVEGAELIAYFATFRQAFAILGFVDVDAEDLIEGLPEEVDNLRPLGVQVGEKYTSFSIASRADRHVSAKQFLGTPKS
jgi:hypothetical protein